MSIYRDEFDYLKKIMDSKQSHCTDYGEAAIKQVPARVRNHAKLPEKTPEEVGLSYSQILGFLKELKENKKLDMHTVTIIKDGAVVCKAEFGPYQADLPQYTFSGCKSVVSIAVGALIGEGKLSVNDKVVDMFPEVKKLNRSMYDKLTVENLLTMQSASTFNEAGALCETDWTREFFTVFQGGNVGKTYNYNSLNTYMLARIVEKKSGKEIDEYLKGKIFAPLEIKGTFWEKCPMGHARGGWGLYICSEDLGKLAMLLLQGGVWNGDRLLPEDYVNAATSSHFSPPETYGDFDYGYQIWIGRKSNSFLFNGMFGQNTFCLKDSGVIVVTTAGNDEFFQQSPYYRIAEKYFDKNTSILKDASVTEKDLSDYLKFLKDPVIRTPLSKFISKKITPEIIERLSGKTYFSAQSLPIGFVPLTAQITTNYFSGGLKRIKFEQRDNGKFYIIFTEENDTVEVPLGIDRYEITDIKYGPNVFRVATRGKITVNEDELPTIKFRASFIEIPSSKTFTMVIDSNTLRYSHIETPGTECIKSAVPFYSGEYLTKGLPAKLNMASMVEDSDLIAYKAAMRFSPSAALTEKTDGASDILENCDNDKNVLPSGESNN